MNNCKMRKKQKRVISYLLVTVMMMSALIPINQTQIHTKAAAKKRIVLIVGGTNRGLIAKSKNDTIYTYRSSNSKVASVSRNGVITGKKVGKVSVVRYKTSKGKTKIDKVGLYQVKKFTISGKKTIYAGGSYLYSSTGTKVKWKSSDKKKATISQKGKLKAKKTGTVTITASVGKKTCKKKVEIKKDEVKSISAQYKGAAIYQNQEIKKSDVKVTAIYKSGRKKEVKAFSLIKNKFENSGKQNFEVTYKGFKTKAAVNVEKKEVKSIQATYQGSPLAVGQRASLKDFHVTVVNNDGTTEVAKENELAISDNTANNKGELPVIITHVKSKKQVTVMVPVTALSILKVNSKYTDDIIFKNDQVDPGKIKIEVTYEDGSSGFVDASDIRIGGVVSEDGKKKISLYYKVDGKEYSTLLSVEERDDKLMGLEVSSENNTLYVGREFNPNQFVVKALYSNGDSRIVTDYKTDYTVSDTPGQKNISFQYTENNITVESVVEVTVKDVAATGIKIVKGINSVKEGAELNPEQMEVALLFEDGNQELISGWTMDYDRNDRTPGVRDITVHYENFSAIMKVDVVSKIVTKLEVVSPTGYTIAGQPLNTTGMSVTAYYDNGTNAVVQGWTTDYSSALGAGTHSLTVNYENQSCSFQVVIVDPLTVSQSESSVITKHPVTVKCNYADVTFSLHSGQASISSSGAGSAVITPNSAGQCSILVTRPTTNESKIVTIQSKNFTCDYKNITASGNVAAGDTLQFTTNAPAQFSYTYIDVNGLKKTGSTYTGTSYNYKTSTTPGTLTIVATDIISKQRYEKTIAVRKGLEISGKSSVKVKSKITLSTTKEKVNWSTSNKEIATVSSSGVVTGKKVGTVKITAQFPEYGNRTVSKTIKVTK